MFTKSRVGVIAIAILPLVLAACGTSAPSASSPASGGEVYQHDQSPQSSSEVLIGAAVSLTGSQSTAGPLVRDGYELAVDQFNADGGVTINGSKVPVKLLIKDDTSDATTAVNLTQELIQQDKVVAMLSSYTTALVEPQTSVAEKFKIPFVASGIAARSAFQKGYKYLFSVDSPVYNLATTVMDLVGQAQKSGELPNPATVALVWENSDHGKDFQDGVKTYAEENGGIKIAVDTSFDVGAGDFTSVVNKVKSANADILLADAHTQDFITLQRQFLSTGQCFDFTTYGGRGTEPAALEALGADGVQYLVSANWWDAAMAAEQPASKAFVEAYKSKYNETPIFYGALGYAAARALLTAIDDAGSTDPDKIREALEKLNITDSILPGGKLSFPAEHGNQAQYPFVVVQNQPPDKQVVLAPSHITTGDGVFPNPSCK